MLLVLDKNRPFTSAPLHAIPFSAHLFRQVIHARTTQCKSIRFGSLRSSTGSTSPPPAQISSRGRNPHSSTTYRISAFMARQSRWNCCISRFPTTQLQQPTPVQPTRKSVRPLADRWEYKYIRNTKKSIGHDTQKSIINTAWNVTNTAEKGPQQKSGANIKNIQKVEPPECIQMSKTQVQAQHYTPAKRSKNKEPAISFSWNFRRIAEEEIDEIEKIISHAEGTAALDVALRYIEQRPDALPHNVLFLKRLRDNAARKRLSTQKQTTLVSFF
ncbi:hypothetical protein AVEN_92311-1 [Araneus ventricosus]|uniref:Uncharacterized protein n=1 Tax=Araneus ventricosus TaxID=182803 RepID=A0A4Y2AN43_ARAVE|nr:hypothetical protein AVEN_92311-1 [Araneus ventricosus]